MTLDITPERIVAALIASRGAEPARAMGTAWPDRQASAEDSGLGEQFNFSIPEFAGKLCEGADVILPKGSGEAYSLGTSLRGGSADAECSTRTGNVFDFDAPNPEGLKRITLMLTSAGIGWVLQVRNRQKAHLHLFYANPQAIAQPIEPQQKKEYSRLISFAISLFETYGGVQLDHHESRRLLALTYSYTKTVETDVVETTFFDGTGFDVANFIGAFPAELKAYHPKTPTAASPEFAALLAPTTDGLTVEQAEIVVAFTALRIKLSINSAPRGHRHTQNLRDSLQLVRATLETAARDGLKIDRDTLTDAVLGWFQPRVDFQTSEGFSADRPPSQDLELAVTSAIDGAFGAGGKVAELASADKFKQVFERATAALHAQRMKLRTSCTIMPLQPTGHSLDN